MGKNQSKPNERKLTTFKETTTSKSLAKKTVANRQSPLHTTQKTMYKGPNDLTQKVCAGLRQKEYYHGYVPQADTQELLAQNGDFLIRVTNKAKHDLYVLSVFWNDAVRHIPIILNDSDWSVHLSTATKTFESIPEMVQHYMDSGEVISAQGAKLIKPRKLAAWEIMNQNLVIEEKPLGAGSFGEVYKGQLIRDTTINVAIKKLQTKGVMDEKERAKFVDEFRLMRHFKHPHIVKTIGIIAETDCLMIVMELVEKGGLDDYLVEYKGVTTVTRKTRFCMEAASGMMYLETNNCIHNDLAARNCLLSGNLHIKISDFGMSVKSKLYIPSKSKRTPFRWIAPECWPPHYIFSSKSDVWSFGILMWEIFSDCEKQPYEELETKEEVYEYINSDKRLKVPECTPNKVERLMQKCWDKTVKGRPNFEEIHTKLEKIYEAMRKDSEERQLARQNDKLRTKKTSSKTNPRKLRLPHSERSSHSE